MRLQIHTKLNLRLLHNTLHTLLSQHPRDVEVLIEGVRMVRKLAKYVLLLWCSASWCCHSSCGAWPRTPRSKAFKGELLQEMIDDTIPHDPESKV